MDTTTQPSSTQELDRLIEVFKDRYGSFESEQYLQDERNYKLAFARGMAELIDREQLRSDIANGTFAQAAQRIRRVYKQPGNNLLNTWDRLPLENAPDEALVRTFYDLLFGSEDFAIRFDAWAAMLIEQNPNCWPAATFFLMLVNPNEHIFVKASPFRSMLIRLRPDVVWSTRPQAAAYAQIQQLARELKTALQPLGARDMIDVQSFTWTVQPEDYRAWVFQSNPRYYDLPGALEAVDHFYWSARQRATDMRVGDTVYLWEAGENAGILAVATIVGEPTVDTGTAVDFRFYRDSASFRSDERRVPLRIDRVLEHRLTRATLLEHPQLSKLQIIQQPNGTNYKVSESDAVALESLVAAIPNAPRGQRMLQHLPPQPLDGLAFVIIHNDNVANGQTYGKSYVFSNHASGASQQLSRAAARIQQGGPPVFVIIYRPYPYHAFSAWARVIRYTEQPGQRDKEIIYTLELEQHEFPQALNLKANAQALINTIPWLSKGLSVAFNGQSIRAISEEVFDMIVHAAYPESQTVHGYLPTSWVSLAAVRDFVQALESKTYTIEELHQQAGELGLGLDSETFAERLCWLRVLTPDGENQYRARDYVAGDAQVLLRLMAFALLVPSHEDAEHFVLPARSIAPFMNGEPQPLDRFAPMLGADGTLVQSWYTEAGLIQIEGTTWRASAGALDELVGDGFLADEVKLVEVYNRFVTALRADVAGNVLSDLEHATGSVPPAVDLDASLRELAAELLVDAAVVRRIYRSIIAGRHVVLSGPPGTGKTELATRLPSLLWREPPQTFVRVTTDPTQPPTLAATEQRHGYATAVVTATEDWGVRDVVGGIGPQLDEQRRLGYTVQHGALTRAVLQHYHNTQNGESLPEQAYTRQDYVEHGRRYRGVWLVIDEFTRAPVDAAFGSLLTTLSGGDNAQLAVPTPGGALQQVPVPADFRIIGTLNSFDRHFLNQISEALKRRFDFIDVLPPTPQLAQQEQGLAAMRGLRKLHEHGFTQILASQDGTFHWQNVLSISRGRAGYALNADEPEARDATESLWRVFSLLRYFRQFGTAQLVALYTNLFAGRLIGMPWQEALDTAFADSIADQLQVLTCDEQQIIELVLTRVGDATLFTTGLQTMLKTSRTNGRRAAIVRVLREAEIRHTGMSTIDLESDQPLGDVSIQALFAPSTPLALSASGVFVRRIRDLIGERGL